MMADKNKQYPLDGDAPKPGTVHDTYEPGRVAPDYPRDADPDEVLAQRQTKKQKHDAERK